MSEVTIDATVRSDFSSGISVAEISAKTKLNIRSVYRVLHASGLVGSRMSACFGCTYDEARALNHGMGLKTQGSPAAKYRAQKAKARVRGVSWEITFPQWIAVWVASGHWEERGRGHGSYCMARHGDIGPYKVGNVSIQLSTTNSRDGWHKRGGGGFVGHASLETPIDKPATGLSA